MLLLRIYYKISNLDFRYLKFGKTNIVHQKETIIFWWIDFPGTFSGFQCLEQLHRKSLPSSFQLFDARTALMS